MFLCGLKLIHGRIARERVIRKALGHLCYVLLAQKNTNTLKFALGYFQLSRLRCCCLCAMFDVPSSQKLLGATITILSLTQFCCFFSKTNKTKKIYRKDWWCFWPHPLRTAVGSLLRQTRPPACNLLTHSHRSL